MERYVDGELAPFAWLLPHDAMAKDIPRTLCGRPGEGELTATETLPRCRGRWLYIFVVASTFAVARENGIHVVFFKMLRKGKPGLRSHRGLGAEYLGSTYYFHLPGLKAPIAWPRRFS